MQIPPERVKGQRNQRCQRYQFFNSGGKKSKRESDSLQKRTEEQSHITADQIKRKEVENKKKLILVRSFFQMIEAIRFAQQSSQRRGEVNNILSPI